jgi:para-aminobenzoate synthetase component 1
MKISAIQLEELPYHPDSCALFDRVKQFPGALFLDSGYPHSRAGRFDIIAADPCIDLSINCLNTDSYESIDKYFQDVAQVHSERCAGLVAPTGDIPFCGGVAGYLNYELGKPLQHLATPDQLGASLYFYEWAVIQDHLLKRCVFVALPSLAARERGELIALLRQPVQDQPQDSFQLQEPFQSNMDRRQYRAAFEQIQRYISAGDCYQVNLAQRFSSHYLGEPWQAYRSLRALAGAPFSGFMHSLSDQQLLCLSPERFLKLSGQHVETRPIKGTSPRHSDPIADQQAAEQLQLSIKDRAENLMIVDLLRNDLGKNCVPGSIQVDRLFELESFPTVHHLVSTISGELQPQRTAFDLLRDSFPGGSITGAPKRRAMQIIDELEPNTRQAYCGSLLYVSADGRMDSNIAIRSLLCEGGTVHCWGGGGIVADSQWQQEYQETLDKVGGFLSELETTLSQSTG